VRGGRGALSQRQSVAPTTPGPTTTAEPTTEVGA
jgi:hypothetical protein